MNPPSQKKKLQKSASKRFGVYLIIFSVENFTNFKKRKIKTSCHKNSEFWESFHTHGGGFHEFAEINRFFFSSRCFLVLPRITAVSCKIQWRK